MAVKLHNSGTSPSPKPIAYSRPGKSTVGHLCCSRSATSSASLPAIEAAWPMSWNSPWSERGNLFDSQWINSHSKFIGTWRPVVFGAHPWTGQSIVHVWLIVLDAAAALRHLPAMMPFSIVHAFSRETGCFKYQAVLLLNEWTTNSNRSRTEPTAVDGGGSRKGKDNRILLRTYIWAQISFYAKTQTTTRTPNTTWGKTGTTATAAVQP